MNTYDVTLLKEIVVRVEAPDDHAAFCKAAEDDYQDGAWGRAEPRRVEVVEVLK